MTLTKQITINSKDFTTIQNIFYTHLKNNPKDYQALKTIQTIINQSID